MNGDPDVRLIHGDCLEILPTLEAGIVDAIVTDPPYGIGYRAEPCGRPGRTNGFVDWGTIANDDGVDGRWLSEAYRVCQDGGVCYLVCRWDVEPEWRRVAIEAGWTVKQRLTWHKRVFGHGDTHGTFGPTCEDVLMLVKGRHILNRRYSMLLDVGCVPTWEVRLHPHQKPVSLPRRLIEASTKLGDLILDPFTGSGTILEACLRTGRRGIGIEIDPTYFEVAWRRLDGPPMPLFEPSAKNGHPAQRSLFDPRPEAAP